MITRQTTMFWYVFGLSFVLLGFPLFGSLIMLITFCLSNF